MKPTKLMARWGEVPHLYVGMTAAVGLFLLMLGYIVLS
jgi:hypothetical protein